MKVYMDRKWCTCWQASCEATFGWKLLHRDFSPGGCVVESIEDGKDVITVYIRDKDVDKVLYITDENWADAYDSWKLLWERQQADKNDIFAM